MKGLKKSRSAYGISEYRLGNGLRLLYKREIAAPVVAVCITFHVGSRNEAKGHTGSTHILEHLLFKDSKKFNRQNGKAITDYLEWFGAYINATTWFDRTNYFELLPKERLAEALELEADRLRGSLFSDADLASEMPVVRNEYERSRNNPFELLDEELMAKAYVKHPYRIPTIGAKEDIEASTAKKLREFYDTFYWPNNATLAVFGDAPLKKVQKLVLKYFAPIPPSPRPLPRMGTVEPAQKSRRSVRMKKKGGVSIAELIYKVPQGTHRDMPALMALAGVLAGGFSSRLQKALVDTGMAADISCTLPLLHDPGVISFTAHAADGIEPEAVLARMRKEIASLARAPVTREELARVKERVRAESAYGRDGVFNEIRNVSESLAAGDWMLGYTAEGSVEKLKPRDVARVAKKYLTPKGETSGVLVGN